jgi:PQQ-like domain
VDSFNRVFVSTGTELQIWNGTTGTVLRTVATSDGVDVIGASESSTLVLMGASVVTVPLNNSLPLVTEWTLPQKYDAGNVVPCANGTYYSYTVALSGKGLVRVGSDGSLVPLSPAQPMYLTTSIDAILIPSGPTAPADMSEVWFVSINGQSNGLVVFTGDMQVRWNWTSTEVFVGSVMIDSALRRVIVSNTNDEADVVSFDLETGERLWHVMIPEPDYQLVSSTGVAFFAKFDTGNLTALAPDGSVVWNVTLPWNEFGELPLVLADAQDRVLFCGRGGQVRDMNTGAVLATMHTAQLNCSGAGQGAGAVAANALVTTTYVAHLSTNVLYAVSF